MWMHEDAEMFSICSVPALTTPRGVTLFLHPKGRGRFENKHCQTESWAGCPHPQTPTPRTCLFPNTVCASGGAEPGAGAGQPGHLQKVTPYPLQEQLYPQYRGATGFVTEALL